MKKTLLALLVVLLAFTTASMVVAADNEYNDANALKGVTETKGLFDINISQPGKLKLYLSVIKKTHADLIRQSQKPDFVIAFRGASVRLITTETWSFSAEDQEALKDSAQLLKDLQSLGVQIEACSIATDLFKVDNNSLLPGIKVVGNTFVSLIGYQSKGYSLVPIQ